MSKKYKPRRANARWMEDAPEYILSVHDNKGKTADRYTVYFGGKLFEYVPFPGAGYGYEGKGPGDTWIQCLSISDAPSHPQGVSMWGEIKAYQRSTRNRIRWLDLPEHIRNHVISRATEE